MAGRAESPYRAVTALVLVAGVAVVLVVAMVGIPRSDAPLPAIARYALEVSLPLWGLTEPVNEIGTRGFDTFGETFLLLAAVVCVVVLTRTRESRYGYLGEHEAGEREQRELDPTEKRRTPDDRRSRDAERREEGYRAGQGPATPDRVPLGTPAPELAQGMTVVVRGAVRLVLPVLAVAGLYLVAWGTRLVAASPAARWCSGWCCWPTRRSAMPGSGGWSGSPCWRRSRC